MKIYRPARHERQYRRGWIPGKHRGVDYGWIEGDSSSRDILAAGRGIVISKVDGGGDNQGWGNRIGIAHTDRAKTFYNHILTDSMRVSVGSRVKLRQIIATQGATGKVDPPGAVHLHFELYIDDVRVDPMPYLKGRALPGKPLIPAYPRRKIRKTLSGRVNMRKSPTTSSKRTRRLKSGTTGTFDAYTHGQKVTQLVSGKLYTSDVWVRGAKGQDWLWAGLLEDRSVSGMKKL